MNEKYFIMSKNNDNSQFYILNSNQSYILPQTNLKYHIDNGLFEKHLIDWSKQFCSRDKTFLDIGAHTGTYSIYLAPYSKQVISFEPQKMTYYALCGSVALSSLYNVTCHNFGLGSQEQVGINELKIRSVDGGGSSLHDLGDRILGTENIEIKTLDSLNLSDIGFIKMDVENNELQVLKGGFNTIKKYKPVILFEANSKEQSLELFRYIKDELNYNKIIGISGVNNMFLACME